MSKPGSLASIAYNAGVIIERLRIIKLLEESDSVCNEWAIALIKNSGNQEEAS